MTIWEKCERASLINRAGPTRGVTHTHTMMEVAIDDMKECGCSVVGSLLKQSYMSCTLNDEKPFFFFRLVFGHT